MMPDTEILDVRLQMSCSEWTTQPRAGRRVVLLRCGTSASSLHHSITPSLSVMTMVPIVMSSWPWSDDHQHQRWYQRRGAPVYSCGARAVSAGAKHGRARSQYRTALPRIHFYSGFTEEDRRLYL
jgi:hypothetical protein